MTIGEIQIRVFPFPRVEPGDDVPELVVRCLRAQHVALRPSDVLVVAQKIVSTGEGRIVRLETIEPSARALALAREVDKDPRLVELVLRESTAIVRRRPGTLIARHRLGFVCANAGVDLSNAGPGCAVLLPADPDASAHRIRAAIADAYGVWVGVIVSDTHGRAHREGAVGVCVGVAGIRPLADHRGRRDLFGYELRSSVEAIADEIASAATPLMGQSDEQHPLALARGFPVTTGVGSAAELVRPRRRDLFE
ncbi:MAG: coenzyme F420-0:L-glutamate ligase [Armatimonadota bacterium]|nr:coenzyme F420-0:L-glutamate ligase [Armatimonadota bacterium]MDR5697756.1 coenzyme F420-0:L-glutamate ligase [Armatimonadota bacterium]